MKSLSKLARNHAFFATVRRGVNGIVDKLDARLRKGRGDRFFSRFVSQDALCFDIGANKGNMTETFLRLGARKVVAVEPGAESALALRERFGADCRVVIDARGLASRPGCRTLRYRPDATDVASMSEAWIDAVQSSGRLDPRIYGWEKTVAVEVTTLDTLIAAYGAPDFCKIDVEGMELEVLEGLSSPLPCLSFEYTPEFANQAVACITRLEKLDRYRYNFSVGLSMRFTGPWRTAATIAHLLENLRDGSANGDVYASLREGPARKPAPEPL